MEIKGKVHCLFEQSGTFKNEFIKLGIPALDYDIQNNFGQTDHVIDLFHEIEEAYDGHPSIFDTVTKDDLIVAFFPCIYFCGNSQIMFSMTHRNFTNMTVHEKAEYMIDRNRNRARFYELLMKLVYNCIERNLRIVVENPISDSYLVVNHFLKKPDIVDRNRMERGDFFVKPTGYWFFNCEPTHGFTHQNDKVKKTITSIEPNHMPGICNEERSMISPDYARNWICDFILGKVQKDKASGFGITLKHV